MDFALLLIRVVVGLLLAAHGTQKLFGWFGGHGVKGTGQFMESIGFKPGKQMAVLAGLGETIGGLLILTGLLTPLGAAAVIAVMLNTYPVHQGKGPFNTNGGWELPLTNATAAAAIAFIGAGSVSLDNAFGWELWGTNWGIAALALGIVGGGINLTIRQARMSTQTSGGNDGTSAAT